MKPLDSPTHIILMTLNLALCCLVLLPPVSGMGDFGMDDSGMDNAVCEICPVNKYCFSGVTMDCPMNSRSLPGSNSSLDCVCKLGYSGPNGGPCTACPAGSFKNLPWGSCTPCPVGSVSETGSASCNSCPVNMTTDVDDVSKCSCNVGYGLDVHEDCQGCAVGGYKDAIGNVTCTQCPMNSRSLPGSNSSLDCVCKLGYSGPNGGPCTACPAGSFKNLPWGSCLPCSVGSVSAPGSAACNSCPVNMTTDVDDVSKCSCREGYGFDGHGDCQECTAGDYKNEIGNLTCTPCPQGSFSNEFAATGCKNCPENEATETNGSSKCVCETSYSRTNGTCTVCPRDTAKDAIGDTQCVCAGGIGYNETTTSCSSCGSGYYKPSLGNDECLKKTRPGFYFLFRMPGSRFDFINNIQQIVLGIIAEIIDIDVAFVTVLDIEESVNNTNARRLLDAGAYINVEIFVNKSQVNTTGLTTPVVNGRLAEHTATNGLMVVLLDVQVIKDFSTPDVENTEDSTILVSILAAVAALLFLMALFALYTNTCGNTQVTPGERSTGWEVGSYSKIHTVDFFEISKRSLSIV
jgi:hypothetical protein